MTERTDQGDHARAPQVAGPRTYHTTERYTGATMQPARAGADDALRIPSLINGRRMDRDTLKALITRPIDEIDKPRPMRLDESKANYIFLGGGSSAAFKPGNETRRFMPLEVPAPPPTVKAPKLRKLTPKREERTSYTPRPTSAPGRVIAHLSEQGGWLSFAQVDASYSPTGQGFGGTRSALFRPAVDAGLLIRVKVYGVPGYALPGFEAPQEATREPEVPGEIRALEHHLHRAAGRYNRVVTELNEAYARFVDVAEQLEAARRKHE